MIRLVLLSDINRELKALNRALERIEEKMPTREELDAAKAELVQAIKDAGDRVVATIDELKSQIAQGTPITQQDLDDLKADVTALSQVDPAATP